MKTPCNIQQAVQASRWQIQDFTYLIIALFTLFNFIIYSFISEAKVTATLQELLGKQISTLI